MVAVVGVRADEMGEAKAAFFSGGGHDVRGLFLPVFLARVGDGGNHAQVVHPVGAVVHVEELFLPRVGSDHFVLEDPQELGGLAESGARGGCAEQTGVVHGQLPAGGAAHAEAADHHAVFVDGIALADIGHGLEGIDLAGELVGAAVATVEVQYESVLGREFARAGHALAEEAELAKLLPTSVGP